MSDEEKDFACSTLQSLAFCKCPMLVLLQLSPNCTASLKRLRPGDAELFFHILQRLVKIPGGHGDAVPVKLVGSAIFRAGVANKQHPLQKDRQVPVIQPHTAVIYPHHIGGLRGHNPDLGQ